jgi:hypothetical protein
MCTFFPINISQCCPHIRPHFVIYNLGQKFATLGLTGRTENVLPALDYAHLLRAHSQLVSCLLASLGIYDKWMQQPPPPDFNSPDLPGESGATGYNRLDPGRRFASHPENLRVCLVEAVEVVAAFLKGAHMTMGSSRL